VPRPVRTFALAAVVLAASAGCGRGGALRGADGPAPTVTDPTPTTVTAAGTDDSIDHDIDGVEHDQDDLDTAVRAADGAP
jgi:hypothetical protein